MAVAQFFLAFFFCGVFWGVFGDSKTLLDPGIFNFEFYLNTNPDLVPGGVSTLKQAENHWIDYGVSEGRQACGAFHSLQYLQRYPNLAQEFGTNYAAAAQHYVTTGRAQGLVGIVDGGAFGRYTAYNNSEGLFFSTSDRMAGAIDSLVWGDVEFINQWDHGRELQMAVTNGSGECYNPTEAGRLDDGTGLLSTSQVISLSVNPQSLSTSVNPAFWLAHDEKEYNPSPACSVGIDTVNVSSYTMTKTVTLGYGGFPRALFYDGQVYQPEFNSFVQTEGPTAYMPASFNVFYSIDLQSGQATLINHNPETSGTSTDPLIFATSDGTTAMGAFSTNNVQYYGWFDFSNLNPPSDATTKWTIVNWNDNVAAGSTLKFPTYIVVGSLNEVVSDMTQLYHALNAKE